MAENSINFPKELLNGCDLLPRTVPYSKDKLDMILTLYVKNYRKLKKNIIYYTSAKLCGYWWTSKLVIVNQTLFSFMSTNANVKETSSCIHKVQGTYVINDNIEKRGSLLISEFCHKAILDSKNGYLHCDRLFIEFRLEMKLSKNKDCSASNSSFQTLIDVHAHWDEYKHLYFPYLRSDLLINVKGLVFPCHGSILTECSKFLEVFFQKNQPLPNKITYIVINDDPVLYRHVMKYIYTGVLNCSDADMRQIYQIANVLQIDSLAKKCMVHFETNLSPSNEKN